MNQRQRTPVLMIGMDAAESTLLERWMEEGALPNLRAMRDRGAFGRLKSTAQWLVGSPWPSFYTSTWPSQHGMYHYLIWRPELMCHERPAPAWLPLQPFWRDISATGKKVVAVDIPLAYAPGSFNGVEISGWATHEILEPPASHPPELMHWVLEKFGKPPFDNEEAHLLPASRLLEVREQCIRTTRLVGDLGVALMQKEPWDLFMVCFAATHRGGHQLWDATSMAGQATADQSAILEHAIKDIYVACDTAIGELMNAAGGSATAIVFSLHGMGANLSRSDILREMLARVLARADGSGGPVVSPRITDRLRALLPIQLRSWVKTRLPIAVQDRLTLFWRTGGTDWSRTRAFAAFCDLDGYIRINMRGREALGIVEPGEEFERLCAEIAAGLKTFVDEDSGTPVVEDIARLTELYPTGDMRKHLPDLMIRWSAEPAAKHRRIVSRLYGAIDWPTPGHHPQGRSGNHWPDGFMLACGEDIAPGSILENPHILDLAPTVYELMGVDPPAHMQGRSLAAELERRNGVA